MRITFALAAALGLVAVPALADTVPASPRPIGPCAGAYVAVTGLTDYRFDGFSESDRKPTWQAIAYCYRADGWFAGTELTGVDFLDQPRTPVEVDWYAGRQMQLKSWKLTAELLYSGFPGKRASGPSYDIVEPQLLAARSFGRLTLDGAAGWETDVSGRGSEWRLRAGASYQLTRWLAASGHYGRFVGAWGADHDHGTWDVGATATWRRLSLDARYGGTDLPPRLCFFTRWCEPGAYAGVTYRVYP
jgi:uncharacterized protein (TIGR02001 family)